MEQFLPGIVQAIIIGVITLGAVYFVKSAKEKSEISQGQKGAPGPGQNAGRSPGDLDFGMIAGSYATVFFTVSIFEGLFAILKLTPNDFVGLIVILDILTVIAWIRQTNYKLMRGIATLAAVSVTALVLAMLRKHLHL
jgi:hypothetical protein